VEHLCRLPRMFEGFAKNFGVRSFTVPPFHKFQGLWICRTAGSILLGLAAQLHGFTGSQKLCFVKLWSTGACRPNIGCSTADVTQVPKKCTNSVNGGEGVPIHPTDEDLSLSPRTKTRSWGPLSAGTPCPLAYLLSAGRALSQLSQYDCAASGVNSLQVWRERISEFWRPCCWDRRRAQRLIFARGESRFCISREPCRLTVLTFLRHSNNR